MDQQLCDEFAKEPWLCSPEFVWYDMVKWQWKTVSMRRCDDYFETGDFALPQ
jgi:hypothetical protein